MTLVDGSLIMAYTAFGMHSKRRVYQIGLTSINVTDFLDRKWNWREKLLAFLGIFNNDAVIFTQKVKGEYVMFHRLETGYLHSSFA